MNKKTNYTVNGALIFGIGNGIINAISQLNKMNLNSDNKFDWMTLLVATVKGAAIGGAGGFVIGAFADYRNSLVKPINTDSFLSSVVNTVRLSKNDSEYLSLNDKASKLIALLKVEFGDILAGEPIRLGSTENGTALADNFDIDICLPFKPGSFSSTSEMYSYLKDCLERLVGRQSIRRSWSADWARRGSRAGRNPAMHNASESAARFHDGVHRRASTS